MSSNWTEIQDGIIIECWPKFGPEWGGWQEVLPMRSTSAIAKRAHQLGVDYDRPSKARGSYERRNDRQIAMPPDPYEHVVMNMLHDGMTPPEIDRHMGFPTGAARLIISNHWLRDKEKNERKRSARSGA